jgi:DNA polymerase I-like protein with 3'-5' exonuclease and polymerase domains
MEDKFTLYNIEKLNKWSKYTSMFSKSKINMEDLLPDHYYNQYLEDLEEANRQISLKDKDIDYLKKFESNQLIFKHLYPVKINLLSYRVFKELEKNETILSNLKSFKAINGFSREVEYNQVSTVTGRLTNTKRSPKILTLPARCRKIFESRWQKDGDLLYVDFKTLEPRVIRKINGKESSDDIYTEISGTLDFEVDRVIIKRGIISTLYGSNSCIDGLSKERSDKVLLATKEYFDLNSILKDASKINEVKCRNNFFGRPIWNINEVKENKLINNYIQSTAVDIALSYFSELAEIVNLELCKPIFIIHDALVLDVHNDYKKEFVHIVNRGYNCKQLGYFPLEIEKLSETY